MKLVLENVILEHVMELILEGGRFPFDQGVCITRLNII